MYQSFQPDPYSTCYCATMSHCSADCPSQEFRSRAQTWSGNDVCVRTRLQDLSPQPQCSGYVSLTSNEDSISSPQGYGSTDQIDLGPTANRGAIAKKSSRKNPWGQETYADLIERAIESYPSKMATIQQIYDYIAKSYTYFLERNDATSSAGWKNSIRHNLSLHDKFLKCPKKNENMKSSLWSINHNSYKRARSNSMDCKKSGSLLVAKRRQMKEQIRNSSTKIIYESVRMTSTRPTKTEKSCKIEPSIVESLTETLPEFIETSTEAQYLPPDISSVDDYSDHSNLHRDLRRMEMTSMKTDFPYDCRGCHFDCRELPEFNVAAMEYSKFVAELFINDLE